MSDDEKEVYEEARENVDDYFTDVTSEIKLDDPKLDDQSFLVSSSVSKITSIGKKGKLVPKSGQFIEIMVDYPEKIGSGMGSYFVYKVTTKTNKPSFLREEMFVRRRFSDFLGLHNLLQEKYVYSGFIIPSAPEKDAFGNTKLKLSKEDQTNSEFLGRRRATLERYLNRIARHPMLVIDGDFRSFLEDENELRKAASSQFNVKKLLRNVGDVVGNITKKMEDCDQTEVAWFEDKQTKMDNIERHLSQIHNCFDQLICQRREMASQTKTFSHVCSHLSHVEEHNGLARALDHLASTEEQIGIIEDKQADIEFFSLQEMLKDYLGLIGSIKDVLNERIRQYRSWQEAEALLVRKREQKDRCELSNKTDKLPQLETEIKECEIRVERTKEDFEKISKTIKKELEDFNVAKVADFRRGIVAVLEAMLASQEEVARHWEQYGPEVTGISS